MSFLDTQELQVGLTNQASFTKIRMKQYDKNTRQINIYLLDSDNQIVELSSTYIAKFQATKPDGKIVFDNCTIDGDKIVYIPNEQLTTTVGEVKCEIGLYKPDVNNSDQLIQSTTFNIQVMESVMNRDGVVSSDSYNALTVLINTVTGVITEAEQAVEAADIAIDNANIATTNANNAATLATNVSERLENETLRIFKPAVNAYAELSTTYPNPEIGWTVTVNELLATYRYNGAEWVNLGSIDCIGNATDTSLGVVKGGGNVDIATDGTLSVPLIQSRTINDSNKPPSSSVTYGINEDVNTLSQQVTQLNNNLAKALTVAEYLNSPYGSGNSVKSSTVIVSGGGLWLVFITCGLGSTSATTGCYLVKMQFTGKIITPITEVPGISVSLDETGLSAGGAKLVITNTSGGKSIDVSLIKVGK